MSEHTTILVIGPTRTATTALWQGLKGLEPVSVAVTKENYFFSRRVTRKTGEDYRDYLSKNFSGDINVDFEPSIFHSNEQLHEAFGNREISTLIGILRRPLDLYISSYTYNVRNGIKSGGFEEFFEKSQSHYSYQRVETTAREAGVTVSWLPHEDIIADPRLFLFASGVPYDYSVAWTLAKLNSSKKQASAVWRVMRKARTLKKIGLVRQASERLRGNPVFERLLYSSSKEAYSIPDNELEAVKKRLLEEDEFFQCLQEQARAKLLVEFKQVLTELE